MKKTLYNDVGHNFMCVHCISVMPGLTDKRDGKIRAVFFQFFFSVLRICEGDTAATTHKHTQGEKSERYYHHHNRYVTVDRMKGSTKRERPRNSERKVHYYFCCFRNRAVKTIATL